MHRESVRLAVMLAGATGLAVLMGTMMKAQAGAAPQEILPALLAEVKGLRAAMEQMASAGPRVELALGRLQLQEQRVNAMIRRLESLGDRRTSAERELETLQIRLKQIGTTDRVTTDPEERAMADMLRAQVKAEQSRLAADIERLTLEETGLSAEIASEQARWTMINQQLEELERALTRR